MNDRPIGDMTPREFLGALSTLTGSEEDAEDDGLGFVDLGNGETDFVFLDRQEYDHGYLLDENDDPVPLPGDAMAGYVDDIFYHFKEHETYGLQQKLRVTLDCEGRRIMMQTGFFTNTAKSLLANLASVQDPGALITIEPSLPDNPDESPNVLFTEVYENDEMIQDSEWPHEDQDVIDLFYEVRGKVFGFDAQEARPQLPDQSLFGDGSDTSSRNGRRPEENSSPKEAGARSPNRHSPA